MLIVLIIFYIFSDIVDYVQNVTVKADNGDERAQLLCYEIGK